MKEKTCCFTGHRVLGNDFKKENLRKAIYDMIDKGVTVFIAGGALGFDTEAALEVLRARKAGKNVELHLYIPCKNQAERWSFTQKWTWKKILKQADFVDMPDYDYYNGCMKVRNYKMVDSSAYCIAYFDGSIKSGTGQTFRYAKRSGLETVNLCTEPWENYYE